MWNAPASLCGKRSNRNVAFKNNFNANGAVMVGAGLVYSLIIEGQPFSLAVMKFIRQEKCFLSMDRYKNKAFDIEEQFI